MHHVHIYIKRERVCVGGGGEKTKVLETSKNVFEPAKIATLESLN